MSHYNSDYQPYSSGSSTAEDPQRFDDPNYRPGRGRQPASAPRYPSSPRTDNFAEAPKKKVLIIGGIVIDELPSSTTRIDTPSLGQDARRGRDLSQSSQRSRSRGLSSEPSAVENYSLSSRPSVSSTPEPAQDRQYAMESKSFTTEEQDGGGWAAPASSGWAVEPENSTTQWKALDEALPVVAEKVESVPEFYEDRSASRTSEVVSPTIDSKYNAPVRIEGPRKPQFEQPLKVYEENNSGSGWSANDSGSGWSVEDTSSGWSTVTAPAPAAIPSFTPSSIPNIPTFVPSAVPEITKPVIEPFVAHAPQVVPIKPVELVEEKSTAKVAVEPVKETKPVSVSSGWAVDSSASGWDIPSNNNGSEWATSEPIAAVQAAPIIQQPIIAPMASEPEPPKPKAESQVASADPKAEMIKCPFCSKCFGYPIQVPLSLADAVPKTIPPKSRY